jgi:hypothetical protein
MSNELNAAIGESGLTVTAALYSGGAAVGSPITMTEIGASGVYTASVPGGTPAGTYQVVCSAGGMPRAAGELAWDGVAEVQAMTHGQVADAVWQRPVEAVYTAEDLHRLMAAVLLGKVSGAGSDIEEFTALAGSKIRVRSHVDSSGNRSSVEVDAS